MAIILARCRPSNPQTKWKMPTKKKSQATKLKVQLKDLRPRKDAKGGGGTQTLQTPLCAKGLTVAPPVNKGYCSGITL
jgi:hypothetical protein